MKTEQAYRMVSRESIPILILGFNRDDLLIASYERLREQGFKNIYVSIDGARNKEDKEKQENMLGHLRNNGLEDDKIRYSSINQGCRFGVLSGISWFFNYVEQGIINEDDIEIEPNYIEYMAALLDRYKGSSTYQSISSHSEDYLRDRQEKSWGIHESPICRVWGWATWRDKWFEHMQWLEKARKLSPVETFRAIPKELRSSELALRIWSCRQGYFNAWDYDWNLTHIMTKRYSLTPMGNFCINHGFREDAMHTKSRSSLPWNTMIEGIYEDQKPIGYGVIAEKYRSILDKCGFPKPGNPLKERILVYSYKPFNKFIKAPVRILFSRLGQLGDRR